MSVSSTLFHMVEVGELIDVWLGLALAVIGELHFISSFNRNPGRSDEWSLTGLCCHVLHPHLNPQYL